MYNKYNILKNNIQYNIMMYCLNCIDSIIPTKTPVLKRQNAEINISSTDNNFVCSNCKTNVIICKKKLIIMFKLRI